MAQLAKWVIIALLLAGVGVYLVSQASEKPDIEPSIADYCAYGAVSMAQLQGCEAHVTPAEIKRLHTDAANFAMGRLGSCLADAGPFCSTQLRNDEQQEANSP